MARLLNSCSRNSCTGSSGVVANSLDANCRLFARGTTTDEELYQHHEEIREAIKSFMRFANGAINEWLGRAN